VYTRRVTSADSQESSHDDVYGRTFALYDRDQLLAFMQPFVDRFTANQLDARALFEGKRCLDAGCGGGRGSLFMLQNGAAHVTGFDFSARNIETTKRNAEKFGYSNIAVQQGTLERLPFDDGSFDVVWCNGVLQHAADPDRCLSEITRVLRVGGRAWIYVYGAGGVYWYAVRHFRMWFRDTTPERLIATLQLAGLEPRYIGEYLDDWKVSYLRAYRANRVIPRLTELGYVDTTPLPLGVPYDTNHRNTRWPTERAWLGEGDLRFLVTKREARSANTLTMGGDDCFDDDAFAPEVHLKFGPPLTALGQAVAAHPVVAALAAARVQRVIRDRLSLAEPLDTAAILAAIEDTRQVVAAVV
jgi:ubiquinone/menaquinone biosynthesis C-methylase UbiE